MLRFSLEYSIFNYFKIGIVAVKIFFETLRERKEVR